MIKKTSATVTVFALAGIMTVVAPMAQAYDQPFHASTNCSPFYPFDNNASSRLYSSTAGMENDLGGPYTSPGTIVCNVDAQRSALDTNDDIQVWYNDQNPNTGGEFVSGDYSINCRAWTLSHDFSVTSALPVGWGCSTTGGCTSYPTTSYAGTGYINLADVPHGPTRMAHVVCQLPRRELGNEIISHGR